MVCAPSFSNSQENFKKESRKHCLNFQTEHSHRQCETNIISKDKFSTKAKKILNKCTNQLLLVLYLLSREYTSGARTLIHIESRRKFQ